MTITNKLNLPEAFVKAVSTAPHNRDGEYSATTLNKGTAEILLTKRHWNELEDDAADRVWATFGTAVHALLEDQEDSNFHEERFAVPVSNSTVTGCVDSYDLEHGVINDWKTASVWKVKMGDFSDWYNQGMTYAWLLTKTGLEVRHCRFIALLKDHSKTKAKTEADYPQSPVFIYQFDVTQEELKQAEDRILAKVKEIESMSDMADEELPACTAEERWSDPDRWAVMKPGRKTAVRLFEDLDEATDYVNDHGIEYFLTKRPGESRKCESYCACKDFCTFYKKLHDSV